MDPREALDTMEQKIKSVAASYQFQPNTADTWANLQAKLENYLSDCWEQGMILGASAAEAYRVEVGLGTTMTAQDILDGTLCVVVQVAVAQPGEFTTITFQQAMLPA